MDGSKGGGWVGLWAGPPPPGDPELIEIFWPKLTCAEGARENFSLAEDLEKNLPNHLRGGGPRGVGGWCQTPPLPGDAELLSKTLPLPLW